MDDPLSPISLLDPVLAHRTTLDEAVLRDYRDRLKSFFKVPYGWYAKPAAFSPLNCARYGWRNIEPNTLHCQSCNSVYYFQLPTSTGAASYEAACERMSKALVQQHSIHCHWRYNPVPEPYYSIPLDSVDVIYADCKRRICLLTSISSELDDIRVELSHSNTKDQSSFDTTRLVAFGRYAADNGNFRPDSIILKLVLLAVCGWSVKDETDEIPSFLPPMPYCEMCCRQLALWNYERRVDQTSNGEFISLNNRSKPQDLGLNRSKFSIMKPFLDPVAEHRPWCPWVLIDGEFHTRLLSPADKSLNSTDTEDEDYTTASDASLPVTENNSAISQETTPRPETHTESTAISIDNHHPPDDNVDSGVATSSPAKVFGIFSHHDDGNQRVSIGNVMEFHFEEFSEQGKDKVENGKSAPQRKSGADDGSNSCTSELPADELGSVNEVLNELVDVAAVVAEFVDSTPTEATTNDESVCSDSFRSDVIITDDDTEAEYAADVESVSDSEPEISDKKHAPVVVSKIHRSETPSVVLKEIVSLVSEEEEAEVQQVQKKNQAPEVVSLSDTEVFTISSGSVEDADARIADSTGSAQNTETITSGTAEVTSGQDDVSIEDTDDVEIFRADNDPDRNTNNRSVLKHEDNDPAVTNDESSDDSVITISSDEEEEDNEEEADSNEDYSADEEMVAELLPYPIEDVSEPFDEVDEEEVEDSEEEIEEEEEENLSEFSDEEDEEELAEDVEDNAENTSPVVFDTANEVNNESNDTDDADETDSEKSKNDDVEVDDSDDDNGENQDSESATSESEAPLENADTMSQQTESTKLNLQHPPTTSTPMVSTSAPTANEKCSESQSHQVSAIDPADSANAKILKYSIPAPLIPNGRSHQIANQISDSATDAAEPKPDEQLENCTRPPGWKTVLDALLKWSSDTFSQYAPRFRSLSRHNSKSSTVNQLPSEVSADLHKSRASRIRRARDLLEEVALPPNKRTRFDAGS